MQTAYSDFVVELKELAAFKNMNAVERRECLFAIADAAGRAFGSYDQRLTLLQIAFRSYLLGVAAGKKED